MKSNCVTPQSRLEDLQLENVELPYSHQSSAIYDISKNQTPAMFNRSQSQLGMATNSSAFVRDQLQKFQIKHGHRILSNTNSREFDSSLGFSHTTSAMISPKNTFMTNLDYSKPATLTSWGKRSNIRENRKNNLPDKINEKKNSYYPQQDKKKIEPFHSNMMDKDNEQQEIAPFYQHKDNFLNSSQQKKYTQLKNEFHHLQDQEKEKEILERQYSAERHKINQQTFVGGIKDQEEMVKKQQNRISHSPALNRKIWHIKTSGQPTDTAYDGVKISRMFNGKQYKTLVGSMNKQIKPISKELEELKYKLNAKYIDQVEKILLKLSIINFDKNQKLKDNANNQIVFDKMMQEICNHRHLLQKHQLAKESIKGKLNARDSEINYLNVPKYDNQWKQDFFSINRMNIKQYLKPWTKEETSVNQQEQLNEILDMYTKGQDELLERLRDDDQQTLYDATKFDEKEQDPFFNDLFLKELMSKHLLFRKGNQKIDFFGTRQIKKRTIEEIFKKFYNPSECSSDIDSEQSFLYLPADQAQKERLEQL